MMKLIAAKPMTYATRRLAAGDLFHASPRDGRLLLALSRAREVPQEGAKTPVKPAPLAKTAANPKTAPKRRQKAAKAS